MKFDPNEGEERSVAIPKQGAFGSYSYRGKGQGVKTLEYKPRFMAPEDAEREATIGMLARDISPHLVYSHYWRDCGTRAEITMDHAGDTLDEFLTNFRPTIPGRIRIVAQMADAIAGLHEYGIAHLDLKPENVFVETKEKHFRVRVGDFGASAVKSEAKARIKIPPPLLEKIRLYDYFHYTPCWGAPEQGVGDGTCASDNYSLAQVAAYVLHGGANQERNTAYFDAAHREVLMHVAALPAGKGVPYFGEVENLFTTLYCSLREPVLRPTAADIAKQAKRVESLIQDLN